MKACGIKKIVFSSSCTVYGQPDILPVTEATEITKAESPYGNTKIVGEAILKDISNTGDLQVISLRYFNPVGAHESALIGELPIGVPNNLVPFITQTAAGLRVSLTVFGNDYNTTDGTCVRDYIHVVDLASAHVKAMDYLNQSNENFEVFNVGTGKGSTVLQVVQAFEKVAGLALNYQIGPRRPGDVEQIWANCEKANTVLGWTAIRNLETMMADAWRWQQRIGEGE
jgi:UDP-glucose 4-epimerase